jgi:hypothetical protein
MEYIDILKWPVLILITIFIFRKPIKELIINIADFSITKDGLSARITRPLSLSSGKHSSVDASHIADIYINENKEGEVIFDYSNNNGIYTIGKGEYRFDTQWSKASKEFIHFYNDQPTIKSIRLIKDVFDFNKINPNKYDNSSRARTVGVNQTALFENNHGKFLAVQILGTKDDSRGDNSDELHFKYKIIN